MNCGEPFKPNHTIKFAERFSDCRLAGDVVAGGKQMRGVDANAQALWLADVINDKTDVFEPMAKTGTLSGGRFQRDARFYLGQSPKHLVNGSYDRSEPGFFACPKVRARM